MTSTVSIPLATAFAAVAAVPAITSTTHNLTDVIAALTTQGYTVTAPAAAAARNSNVFVAGKFSWAGDWSSQAMNYDFVESPGATPVIQLPSGVQWAYWLPYPPQNAAGPSANGINFEITGYTHFNFSVKPAKAGGQASVGFYKGSGTTDDVANGGSIGTGATAYGPSAMAANAWNKYSIPLADFKLTNTDWIYKFIIQQQNVTPDTWEIDAVYFS